MSRRPTLNFLDWRAGGYHTFPLHPGVPGYAGAEDAALWAPFETFLAEAKAGRFERMDGVLDVYDQTESWVLAAAYTALLGDAAPRSCLEKVGLLAQALLEPAYQVDFCKMLGAASRLADVPLLLWSWEQLEGYNDRDVIPRLLSRMLEARPGPIASNHEVLPLEEYKARVLAAQEELAGRLGGTEVTVLAGQRFEVPALVGLMLESLRHDDLDPWLRRRFEATTGIDCSAFYKEQGLQPLVARTMLEGFLGSEEARHFVPGARYFFGHRIPE
jgi:hypothetical protein